MKQRLYFNSREVPPFLLILVKFQTWHDINQLLFKLIIVSELSEYHVIGYLPS